MGYLNLKPVVIVKDPFLRRKGRVFTSEYDGSDGSDGREEEDELGWDLVRGSDEEEEVLHGDMTTAGRTVGKEEEEEVDDEGDDDPLFWGRNCGKDFVNALKKDWRGVPEERPTSMEGRVFGPYSWEELAGFVEDGFPDF